MIIFPKNVPIVYQRLPPEDVQSLGNGSNKKLPYHQGYDDITINEAEEVLCPLPETGGTKANLQTSAPLDLEKFIVDIESDDGHSLKLSRTSRLDVHEPT
ncbi:hypothetical protein E4U57_003430 [Claviceps arundinis]|uniref:Uncharacterized protein n=1 Tax=Claviceps arundinis TaxID=1623583 RepID=A0ABQ7P6R9_9HYPO|nr:hypothetical protein E4U57_003430 [Claviceps arundinis]